jgi:hypothetical protein
MVSIQKVGAGRVSLTMAAVLLGLAPLGRAEVAANAVVRDAETKAPIAGARVACGGEAPHEADAEGRVSWVPGASCEASAPGYWPASVPTGPEPPAEILLAPAGRFRETVDVKASEELPEAPSTVAVTPRQVQNVAGGAENVFRVLQTLPGVAAVEDFGSRLSVRGGGPDQNLTVLDGIEVHNPYRLFGLISAFNPETVDSFELTAGAFSAKYGDRLSSLLVVENRPGSASRGFGGSAALSLTDSNLILEGRLPRDGSWLVTGRRTYYDLVAESFTDDDLPSFGDLQAALRMPLGGGRSLEVTGLLSRENTDAAFEGDFPGDEGALLTTASNDLVSASFRTPLGTNAASSTLVAWYRNVDSVGFDGEFRDEAQRSNGPDDDRAFGRVQIIFTREYVVEDTSLRQELAFQVGRRHHFESGFEIHGLRTGWDYVIEGDRNEGMANGSSIRGGSGLPDELHSSLRSTRGGVFLLDRFDATPALTIEGGLRWDRSSVNDDSSISPRLALFWQAGTGTRAKLALGLHTQTPGYEKTLQSDYFVDLGDGGADDPALRNERAFHVVAGVERELGRGVVARIEGYHKTFDRLLIGRLETEEERLARIATYDFPAELASEIPTAPQITISPSEGKGQAYGFELYLARTASSPETRLTGWMSYSWGVARRTQYGRTYPFDYDRPHALSVVGSYRFSHKLELSATGRVASGFPRTPVVGLRVASDADERGKLVPARDLDGLLVYGTNLGDTTNLNTARLPYFARLDLRLTFTPRWGSGRWHFYADLINVLGRKNAGMLESKLHYDPSSELPRLEETREGSLPFLPSVGVHVRF